MTIAYSGDNITFPDASVQNTAFKTGMVNRIINGDMRIDQRNAGASVSNTTSIAYTTDRWNIYGSVAGKFTAEQNAASVTPPAGFANYLGMTSSSAYTVGAAETFQLQQQIEGFNSSDLAWGTASAKTVTLSFWVYSSLTGTFGGSLSNSTVAYAHPFSYSIPTANTWTQISITITGPTAGTWIGATNGIGVRVYFGLGVGSTLSGTAGAWAAADYRSATGATSVVGTSGATFYITGVQLEKGSTATSFDYRQYGTELQLAQRYFQVWRAGWNGVSAGSGYQYSDGVNFTVTARSTPTITLTSYTTGARFPQANWLAYSIGVQGFIAIAAANAAGGNDNWLAVGTASAEL